MEFSYTLRTTILENMCKKFKLKFKFKHVLIELSIYFQGKIKFSHWIWSIWVFWILTLI